MLKKAGIVVAAAAAGLLAVSPLAFAGEHGKGHHRGSDDVNSYYQTSQGLVNVSDINANVPVNALNCLDTNVAALGGFNESSTLPITGALALLGSAEAEQVNVVDDSCANAQGASTVDSVSQNN